MAANCCRCKQCSYAASFCVRASSLGSRACGLAPRNPRENLRKQCKPNCLGQPTSRSRRGSRQALSGPGLDLGTCFRETVQPYRRLCGGFKTSAGTWPLLSSTNLDGWGQCSLPAITAAGNTCLQDYWDCACFSNENIERSSLHVRSISG